MSSNPSSALAQEQRKPPQNLASISTSGISATAVSTGGAHTCALTTSGGVKCWGLNSAGQLGDGTTTDRHAPVDVSGLTSNVTAISAGAWHTCALTTSGGVKCWGSNGYGQLGDGTTTDRHTPVDVAGLTSGVRAIAAGGAHTCVLTTSGAVKCWGFNYYGQLGDATTTERQVPVNVSGLTNDAMAVTAGTMHTCALTTSGGVKCWGANVVYQLGDGTATNRSTPVSVVGLTSTITAIAAGSAHTCALTTSGGVKCWGYNYAGELGDGTTIGRPTPVDVAGMTSGAIAVETGWGYTCGLTSTGGVKCWGKNNYGQLGDGTTTDYYTPTNVSGLTSDVASIAAGGAIGAHTCALMTSGGVKCWGYNQYGQIGDGTTTDRYTPVNVVGLGGSTDYSSLATTFVPGTLDVIDLSLTNTHFNSDGSVTTDVKITSRKAITYDLVFNNYNQVDVPFGMLSSGFVPLVGGNQSWTLKNVVFHRDSALTIQLSKFGFDNTRSFDIMLWDILTVITLSTIGSPPPVTPPEVLSTTLSQVSKLLNANGCLDFGPALVDFQGGNWLDGVKAAATAAVNCAPLDHDLILAISTQAGNPINLPTSSIQSALDQFNAGIKIVNLLGYLNDLVSAPSDGAVTISYGNTPNQPVTWGGSWYATPGATQNFPFDVPTGTSLITFLSNWTGSTISLTLTRPDGTVADLSDPTIIHNTTPNSETYQITNPMPGIWHMGLTAVTVPAGGESVTLNVTIPSTAGSSFPIATITVTTNAAPPPTTTPKAPRQEDSYEPDDTMGSAHTITGKELHNFCGPKDEDWVKFLAKAGWTYHIKADPPANFPTEPHLELYVNGSVAAQNDHYFGNIAEIWWWNNGGDQTVYVRATELQGRGDCGSSTYTLSVEGTQGKP